MTKRMNQYVWFIELAIHGHYTQLYTPKIQLDLNAPCLVVAINRKSCQVAVLNRLRK